MEILTWLILTWQRWITDKNTFCHERMTFRSLSLWHYKYLFCISIKCAIAENVALHKLANVVALDWLFMPFGLISLYFVFVYVCLCIWLQERKCQFCAEVFYLYKMQKAQWNKCSCYLDFALHARSLVGLVNFQQASLLCQSGCPDQNQENPRVFHVPTLHPCLLRCMLRCWKGSAQQKSILWNGCVNFPLSFLHSTQQ